MSSNDTLNSTTPTNSTDLNWPTAEDNYIWSMNKLWIVVCGAMVFSMQIGFAFLEAGLIRKKSQTIPFYRILLNGFTTILGFWLVGFAFGFGDAYNKIIGGKYYYGGNWLNMPDSNTGEITQYAIFMFYCSVGIMIINIANGSISERICFLGSTLHAFVLALGMYPITIAWTWGGGWLTQNGYIDYSGAGIVHTSGAFVGLAGIFLLGPRYNRWNRYRSISNKDTNLALKISKNKEPGTMESNEAKDLSDKDDVFDKLITPSRLAELRNKVNEDEYENFGVTNLTYIIFGTLFLWCGLIFYSGGSTLGLLKVQSTTPKKLWSIAEITCANALISGCSGALFALNFKTPLMNGLKSSRKLRTEASGVCHGLLAGIIACASGTDHFQLWDAFIVGILGSFVYCLFCKIADKFKIDDAMESFQVHGGGGLAGVLSTAFFHNDKGILFGNPTNGKIFGIQLMGWVVIAFWSFSYSIVIYAILKWIGFFRIDFKTEVIGYDFIEYAEDIDFAGKRLIKLDDDKQREEYRLKSQ